MVSHWITLFRELPLFTYYYYFVVDVALLLI